MNCGEAVKPGQYVVEAPRKQVPNRSPGEKFEGVDLSVLMVANPWQKI
jgi:hypothetical protein